MKIGLFFGSFNPVHNGHLIIANYISQTTDLDKVWLVVSPQNPLKQKETLLKDHDRLHLINLAIEDCKHLKSSNIEFKLPKPSYTIDTLVYLRHETKVWFEITTLLIPGYNDSDLEISAMCRWIVNEIGGDVPLHFSAFHPDYKMPDVNATPLTTLVRARNIALQAGLHFVYTGNVHHEAGDTTCCANCHSPLIVRDWYQIKHYGLNPEGRCAHCGTALAGRFDAHCGNFGRQRIPVRLHQLHNNGD